MLLNNKIGICYEKWFIRCLSYTTNDCVDGRSSCLCLDLDQGKTSVGISMNVSHDMASPLGTTITIEAKMVHVEGRKIDYEVRKAFQDGKSIGKGVHSRFVVDAQKFYG